MKIAYLNSEDSANLDFDSSTTDNALEDIKTKVLEHENTKYYSLEDFVTLFNSKYISDLGYIAIKK